MTVSESAQTWQLSWSTPPAFNQFWLAVPSARSPASSRCLLWKSILPAPTFSFNFYKNGLRFLKLYRVGWLISLHISLHTSGTDFPAFLVCLWGQVSVLTRIWWPHKTSHAFLHAHFLRHLLTGCKKSEGGELEGSREGGSHQWERFGCLDAYRNTAASPVEQDTNKNYIFICVKAQSLGGIQQLASPG